MTFDPRWDAFLKWDWPIAGWRNPVCCLVLLVCLFHPPAVLATDEAGASAVGPLEHLTLIAPAAGGGGWDLTAQAMKQVLEAEGIVRSVEIEHIPGDGGLQGLQNFVSSRRSDAQSLLVGGMSMVSTAVSRRAVTALNNVTPIAQVTADADVVVVPASSPYRNLDDLLAAMRSNPDAMHWAGGSVGGSDHPTMWQLARAAGMTPELMHYESFAGASEVAMQLASGRFSAGIDGYSELDRFIRSGQLRGLAVVSRQPLEGVSIPTFRQLGIVGASISNWCGVFAPPGVSENERGPIQGAIQRMVQSSSWRTTLARYHLRSAYLGTADFSQLVEQERTRVSKSEAIAQAAANLRWLSNPRQLRLEWLLAVAGGIVALLIALRWQWLRARRREEDLGRALQDLSQEVECRTREALQRTEDMVAARAGMCAQIEREFDRWVLTSAERSVAHLILKGLRLKDIARARNTSDRTIRQQAQSIYRKAGLDGRTDLAAYFLDSVLGARSLGSQITVSSELAARPPLQLGSARVSEPISGVSRAPRQQGFRGAAVHERAVIPLTTAAAQSR